MANEDVMQGKWKQLKGKFKQKWGDFTDDELLKSEGDRDRLSGMLQEKYGYTKERAQREISQFFSDADRAM